MTTAVETRGHLIGGEQVPARSGATFETVDPATAEPFATLAAGDEEDVDLAARTARAALAERGARRAETPLREAQRDIGLAPRAGTYYAGWPTKLRGTTNPADPGV